MWRFGWRYERSWRAHETKDAESGDGKRSARERTGTTRAGESGAGDAHIDIERDETRDRGRRREDVTCAGLWANTRCMRRWLQGRPQLLQPHAHSAEDWAKLGLHHHRPQLGLRLSTTTRPPPPVHFSATPPIPSHLRPPARLSSHTQPCRRFTPCPTTRCVAARLTAPSPSCPSSR